MRRIAVLVVTIRLAAQVEAEPVAIIAGLSGSVAMTSAHGQTRDARQLDWLVPGMSIHCRRGSHLLVDFANGRRFEIDDDARAAITASGLKRLSGSVRELPQRPPMPKFPAIAEQENTSADSAAVVLRNIGVNSMHPSGYCTLANNTVLSFATDASVKSYRVRVADTSGTIIYQTNTTSHTISIPPGILQAGEQYYWQLHSVGDGSTRPIGMASFTTLGVEDVTLRAQFAASLSRVDSDSLALLAAIDWKLGLRDQAREELHEAVRRSRQPETLKLLLNHLEYGSNDK